MTRSDEVKMIHDEFKEHVATISTAPCHLGEMTVLEWANPKNGHYRIVYTMIGGILMVYGDCGSATYGWACKLTPEFLGSLQLQYFASKCQACDGERRGLDWSEDYLEQWLDERLRQEAAPKFAKKARTVINEIACYDAADEILSNRGAWHQFIHDNYDEVQKLIGDPSDIGDIAMRPSITCHRHLIGLKLAAAQLQAKLTDASCACEVLA